MVKTNPFVRVDSLHRVVYSSDLQSDPVSPAAEAAVSRTGALNAAAEAGFGPELAEGEPSNSLRTVSIGHPGGRQGRDY